MFIGRLLRGSHCVRISMWCISTRISNLGGSKQHFFLKMWKLRHGEFSQLVLAEEADSVGRPRDERGCSSHVDLKLASHSHPGSPWAGVPSAGFPLSTYFTFAWFMDVFAVYHLPLPVIQWQTEGERRLALEDLSMTAC